MATVFFIDTDSTQGRLVAVDGHAVQPVTGTRFGLAMGQRLDIEIHLPNEGGAWPPMSTVDVALDAGDAAHWMLHCHHMPHLATGMMTDFAVTASA